MSGPKPSKKHHFAPQAQLQRCAADAEETPDFIAAQIAEFWQSRFER